MYRIRWFQTWSLRRMLALFLAIFLMLAMLAIATNIWIAARELNKNSILNAQTYVSDEINSVHRSLSSIRSSLVVLANKDELRNYLQGNNAYRALNARMIISTLNDILRYIPQISNVCILTNQGQVLASQYGYGLSIEDYLERQVLFESILDMAPTKPLHLPLEFSDQGSFVFASVVPVNEGGYCIALSTMEDFISPLRFVNHPYMISDGQDIYIAEHLDLLSPTEFEHLDGEEAIIGNTHYRVISDNLEPLDWQVTMSYPRTGHVNSINALIRAGVTYGLIFTICGALLAILLYLGFLYPIRNIHKQTMDVRIQDGLILNPITGKNELSTLAQSINDIILRSNKLGQEITQAKMDLIQLELERLRAKNMFLQAQINPHFLYNMLGCICGMASAEDAPKTREISALLAKLYRYNVDKFEGSMEEELECVRIYHEIIKLRYDEAYTIHIDVPEELLDLQLPRMILEPIVENAIQHGFVRGRMESGTIRITADLQNEQLDIRVSDNGSGVSDEQLEIINKKLQQPKLEESSKTSIGLYNVNSRIKLRYGKESGLRLHKNPGGGLCVAITIHTANLPHPDRDETE